MQGRAAEPAETPRAQPFVHIRYSMKYAQKKDAGARGSRSAPRARAARAVPPSSSSKPPRVRSAGGAARRGRRTPSWSAPAPLATGAAQKRAPAAPYTVRAPGSAAGRTPDPGAVGRRRVRSLKTQDRLQLVPPPRTDGQPSFFSSMTRPFFLSFPRHGGSFWFGCFLLPGSSLAEGRARGRPEALRT